MAGQSRDRSGVSANPNRYPDLGLAAVQGNRLAIALL